MSVRSVVGLLLVLAYMVFVSVPGLVLGLVDPKRRTILAITRGWARLILWCGGIRVTVSGAENVPHGPAVFASNHASALDIPLLFAHLPADFRIIHKKSLYWAPIVGAYLFFGGHVGIDRKNPFRARQSLIKAAKRIRAGMNVATFPEGTRSPDGRLQPFKRGTFVLAQDAGVPVVPVSLIGVKALVPCGLVRMRAGSVQMRIHPPVDTEGRTADDVAAEVRAAILSDFGETAA
jgi:1-acyl-sn-glycerol-3-phosphate acyltransferase